MEPQSISAHKEHSIAPLPDALGFSRSNPGSARSPYEFKQALPDGRYVVLEIPTQDLVEISSEEWLSPWEMGKLIESEVRHRLTREEVVGCSDALRRGIRWLKAKSSREEMVQLNGQRAPILGDALHAARENEPRLGERANSSDRTGGSEVYQVSVPGDLDELPLSPIPRRVPRPFGL